MQTPVEVQRPFYRLLGITEAAPVATPAIEDFFASGANAERFTDMAKVEKWFARNCNSVLGRACTAQEKGDVATWLVAQ